MVWRGSFTMGELFGRQPVRSCVWVRENDPIHLLASFGQSDRLWGN